MNINKKITICPKCNGKTIVEGSVCKECEGEGVVLIVTTITTTTIPYRGENIK